MKLSNETILALAIAIASPTLVSAQSRAFKQCWERAQGITATSRECQFAEEARQDKELNNVYAKLTQKLQQRFKEGLIKSERSWLVYRSAECDFEMVPGYNGSIAPLLAGDCWIALTEERIKRLRVVMRELL